MPPAATECPSLYIEVTRTALESTINAYLTLLPHLFVLSSARGKVPGATYGKPPMIAGANGKLRQLKCFTQRPKIYGFFEKFSFQPAQSGARAGSNQAQRAIQ